MDLCLFVFEFAKFLRQPPVESFVQPAKKFDRANRPAGIGGSLRFHLGLNLHVGEVLDLERTLSGVCGKILPEGRVNVPGPCAMAFDQVRVVAVHRAHQVGHAVAGDGVQRSAEPFRAADERQSQGQTIFVDPLQARAAPCPMDDRKVFWWLFFWSYLPILLPIQYYIKYRYLQVIYQVLSV